MLSKASLLTRSAKRLKTPSFYDEEDRVCFNTDGGVCWQVEMA